MSRSKPGRAKFTKAYLDGLLKSKPERQTVIWDSDETGLNVLVSPGPEHRDEATITFRVCYYLEKEPGKPRYIKIGRYGHRVGYRDQNGVLKTLDCSDIKAVRNRARDIRNGAAAGIDPRRPRSSGNVDEIISEYLDRDKVKANRTFSETKRIFDRYVIPEWADRNIEEIERNDVSSLLKKIARRKIEGPNGRMLGTPNQADSVYSQLSALFNWYVANKSDKFVSPITKGMREETRKSKKRERFLDDDEIAAMWQACSEFGVYGACLKTALLTAQRFFKVAEMRRSHIADDKVWDGGSNDDPKNKRVSPVPLPSLAYSIIQSVPVIDAGRHSRDYVFSTNGKTPFQGWSSAKERLDERMAKILGREKIEPWQHRDLRRTARTLLAALGVSDEVAEHCLGHVLGDMQGVYNRHDYLDEKRVAFQVLANKIEKITTPEVEDFERIEADPYL